MWPRIKITWIYFPNKYMTKTILVRTATVLETILLLFLWWMKFQAKSTSYRKKIIGIPLIK